MQTPRRRPAKIAMLPDDRAPVHRFGHHRVKGLDASHEPADTRFWCDPFMPPQLDICSRECHIAALVGLEKGKFATRYRWQGRPARPERSWHGSCTEANQVRVVWRKDRLDVGSVDSTGSGH
jgi:hypothetical protein